MRRSQICSTWRFVAAGAMSIPLVLGAGSFAVRAAGASTAVLKAVVTLSPKTSTVGERVTARVNKSTLPKGVKVKAIALNWGDHTKTVALDSLVSVATHVYARPGRYSVVVLITDQKLKAARSSAIEIVTPVSPLVGSYTGTNPQNGSSITLFVSENRKTLQDISIPEVYLTCLPGGATLTDRLQIASTSISTLGSFSAATTQHGVISGDPATFNYSFKGGYEGLNSSGVATFGGTFRETLSYTNSAARVCTSGNQSWTATRDTQPPQPASAPPSGSYTATNPQNGSSITFFVASNRKTLQDISIPEVYLTCAPGGLTLTDHVQIPSIAINAAGAFAATTSTEGVLSGYTAQFTYTFRGNFHGVNAMGAARAAGTFRETVNYTDSAARDCTSNDQSWTAARDTQPAQPTTAPPIGSYSATNPQNGSGVTFYVASDRKALQDISIPEVYLTCAPGGATLTDHIQIPSVTLSAAGSFSTTTSTSGVIGGYVAAFFFTFRGNFHGVSPEGAARAAGTFREQITYTDTTSEVCTSNDQSWTATRDVQPAQPTTLPPIGDYAGTNPQNGSPVTFTVGTVEANQLGLENVSVPTVYLTCAPGDGTLSEPLSIASIDINADGSFSGSAMQSVIVQSLPGTATYTFRGNFHGVSASGAARAAGTFRETITYDGKTCTSNDQAWLATKTAS